MPRRSARNIAKDSQSQDDSELENDTKQLPPGVVEVIDEFVAVAENQEGLESQDDMCKDPEVDADTKETEVSGFL